MHIEIKYRSGNTLLAGEYASIAECVVTNRANLCFADLRGADLRGADLQDANLRGADLHDADLRGADLHYADLSGATLYRADLSGAKLCAAKLSVLRRDVEHVLFANPNEALAVADALDAGRVNGSIYEGECACLIGTLLNARRAKGVPCAITDFECDASRPAEQWFKQFIPGRSSANYEPARITAQWIRDWHAKYGPKAEA